MQAKTEKLRKMGFLEKITLLFHDQMAGSTAVAAMIKINTIIEFQRFKEAWRVLFLRQPLLRATLHVDDADYFFNFNAQFNHILFKHINSNNFSDVMQEYSHGVIKEFNLNLYFWRATLVTMPNEHCSYIIFGAQHTICDAKSTSQLLGDLLRIIQELDNNITPNCDSFPIPQALDLILDRSKFTKPAIAATPPATQLLFENKVAVDKAQSTNILKTLNADIFAQLLAACRMHNTTITAALCAALTKSIFENKTCDELDLSIAFDLRPYTKEKTSHQVLAFYAHQLLFNLDLKVDCSFWNLARQSQEKYQQAINEYTLESADNNELFSNIAAGITAHFDKGKFFVPYTITNAGVVDEAFIGLEAKYKAEHFSFTILNQQLFGLIICTSTLNNNLHLNFNFSVPALSEESATKLIERTIFYLMNNIG